MLGSGKGKFSTPAAIMKTRWFHFRPVATWKIRPCKKVNWRTATCSLNVGIWRAWIIISLVSAIKPIRCSMRYWPLLTTPWRYDWLARVSMVAEQRIQKYQHRHFCQPQHPYQRRFWIERFQSNVVELKCYWTVCRCKKSYPVIFIAVKNYPDC